MNKQEIKRRKRALPKPKAKTNLVTKIGILFICIGIGTLIYPIVGNYMANRERSTATQTYNKEIKQMTKEEKEKQYELAKIYNDELYKRQEEISNDNTVSYESIIGNQSVMGTIEVPALDIKSLPFYHGTSYQTLDKGLGHFEKSSIPIGGKNTRSVITGHSGMKNQVLFTDIRYLKEGDIFFIHILGETLAYQIESFEEVLPEQVDRIAIQKDKDMVTLLTCTPPGINTYRLLVNGKRIPYEEAIQKKVVKRNLLSYQTLVIGSLIICTIVSLIIWLIYKHLKKKTNSINPIEAKKARKKIKYLIYVIRTLFITLLIAMIAVLIIALYGYTKMKTESALDDVNIGQSEELYAYNADKILNANYDSKQVQSINTAAYASSLEKKQESVNKWGIGKILIPDVDIDLPILSGILNDNLSIGAATYKKDQVMGESNYILMSHNLIGANVLLNNINKLKIGNQITITDFKNSYIYEVTRNEVIKETEVDVLEDTDEPIITLIRCEGGIGTDKRELVQGKLVKTIPLDSANENYIKQLGLTKEKDKNISQIVKKNPLSFWEQVGIYLASTIMQDPLQTIIPLLLLFFIPIIILSIIN